MLWRILRNTGQELHWFSISYLGWRLTSLYMRVSKERLTSRGWRTRGYQAACNRFISVKPHKCAFSLVRVINYWPSFCLQRKMQKQRCTVQFQVRPVCNWREKPYQLPKYKCHLTGSSILGWTLERRGSHSTGDWTLLFAMGVWGPGASHEWDTKSVRAGGPDGELCLWEQCSQAHRCSVSS